MFSNFDHTCHRKKKTKQRLSKPPPRRPPRWKPEEPRRGAQHASLTAPFVVQSFLGVVAARTALLLIASLANCLGEER